jgi:hypothetical protein
MKRVKLRKRPARPKMPERIARSVCDTGHNSNQGKAKCESDYAFFIFSPLNFL